MFNYHSSSYNTCRMFYSKKKTSAHCYSKSKYNSKKYKCTFIELDDNYSYQTTETSSSKDSNSTQTQNVLCQEVTEFTLGINEVNYNDNNKENNSLLSNIQDNSLRYDKCYCIDNSNNVSLLSQSSLTDVSDSIKEDTTNNDSNNSSSSSNNKTIINLSDDTLKEAFFFPKKLTNMYNYIYNQFQYQYHLYNTIAQSHYYKNNIYYNSNNSNSSFTTTPTIVNKDNTSSLTTTTHNDDKDKENTDVLCVNLKISPNETLVFKIRRYDDMFKTVKMFCEINNLDASYIRPLITYVIKTMNMIYGIMNMKLTYDEVSYLQMIKHQTNNNDLNNSSL